jgi:hypothetical protein
MIKAGRRNEISALLDFIMGYTKIACDFEVDTLQLMELLQRC